MQPGTTLVLFTSSYPFGHGEQFIETEIIYLSQAFGNIVVLPNSISGSPRPVPANVRVDYSLLPKAEHQSWFYLKSVSLSLRTTSLYRELLSRPKVLSSYSSLYSLIACITYALRTKSWIVNRCRNRELNVSKTIFYTYWFGAPTLGLALARRKYSKLVIVTRAHGGDLYEERNAQAYLPCRFEMIEGITRIYTVSLDGHNYLVNKYPQSQGCCKVSRLGVNSHQFTTAFSTDGVFRIISCSSLVPVKRVSLIIKSLSALAEFMPDTKIEWNHLGSGPLCRRLESLAHSILPSHMLWKFHGSVDNSQVFAFYRANPIDLFINVSKSEGIPVSIMEAQSCGIPVIAPAVGGIPEIVNNQNGILLPPDPKPHDVAQALQRFINNPKDMREQRNYSKANWYAHYNADSNYRRFSRELLGLLEIEGVSD